ncbi:hypothetical protein CORC01_08734 [Colletotrichum orchidophilum]|uniref:Uncharacterized protein n=1 Tax=Colletotrichum orchidophilum TaxID=1209926 RepID=A0A1G4B3R5_9PEZI|nr:uncharacterized protein CORC01_08734 [Colletotrichum orchidophilum]OHE96041.1 hypothetical protein CORC01_08734 [Colletotrichum orchidophilum]
MGNLLPFVIYWGIAAAADCTRNDVVRWGPFEHNPDRNLPTSVGQTESYAWDNNWITIEMLSTKVAVNPYHEAPKDYTTLNIVNHGSLNLRVRIETGHGEPWEYFLPSNVNCDVGDYFIHADAPYQPISDSALSAAVDDEHASIGFSRFAAFDKALYHCSKPGKVIIRLSGISIPLVILASALNQGITLNIFVTMASSTFRQHSSLAAVNTASQIIHPINKPFIGKLVDIPSR